MRLDIEHPRPLPDILRYGNHAHVHGGYPGEIVIQDEYTACPDCGKAFPLEEEDRCCYMCGAVLEVRRAYTPEFTIRLPL